MKASAPYLHLSVWHIKPRLPDYSNFTFHEINQDEAFNLLQKAWPEKKVTGNKSFLPKIMKLATQEFFQPLTTLVNDSIKSAKFPSQLKCAEISPLYKAADPQFSLSKSLKRKCRHFDEIWITGCTGSCHFDNFQCSQWWKFHQNEDISVSVVNCHVC